MTTVTSPTTAHPADLHRGSDRRARRVLFAIVGVLNVGIGGVGVIVPGLPTTIFLIAATYCFARSCPALERRLLRNRFFAPYMRFVDGVEPLPRRSRITATVAMCICVSVSLSVLAATGALSGWLAALIVMLAGCGCVAIWTIRR